MISQILANLGCKKMQIMYMNYKMGIEGFLVIVQCNF